MRDEHGIGISQGSVCNCKVLPPLRYQGPEIHSDKKRGETSWREWTPAIQQLQRLKKKASWSQDTAVIELGDGTHPVALGSFSDLHMGAWSVDYNLLTRLTDELLATKHLYIGLLGDYGHYAIKLRNVLEVADNILPPEQQTQFLESWFKHEENPVKEGDLLQRHRPHQLESRRANLLRGRLALLSRQINAQSRPLVDAVHAFRRDG